MMTLVTDGNHFDTQNFVKNYTIMEKNFIAQAQLTEMFFFAPMSLSP